ncbi:MAG: tRNA (adenosine(37)-N6)-dimethylallyltransferase MiaA [Cytophagaceae bacterium]|jgi:tRNA dimethylallyltransferase|nr:tRNA (adenosine(37)-N6)-dimethylallyltransferase MiaA [Cytophagaceae bacterium]
MPPLLVISGPTASGKTELAVQVAVALNAEIISADSRQVFKRMNIGTGKDYNAYRTTTGEKIPYHLIDIREPGEEYSVTDFVQDASKVLEQLEEKNKTALVCGGSGFYIQGLLQSMERTQVPPDHAFRNRLQSLSKEELLSLLQTYPALESVDTQSKQRIIRALEIARYEAAHGRLQREDEKRAHVFFALDLPREIRRKKISDRFSKRMQEGMVEEVQHLLQEGIAPEKLQRYGLEYKFICDYLLGLYSYEKLLELLETAIQQYAKRQMTWLRKMEKDGYCIHWLSAMDEPYRNVQRIQEILHKYSAT